MVFSASLPLAVYCTYPEKKHENICFRKHRIVGKAVTMGGCFGCLNTNEISWKIWTTKLTTGLDSGYRFRSGLCPRPDWGSLQRSPKPLAGGEGLATRRVSGSALRASQCRPPSPPTPKIYPSYGHGIWRFSVVVASFIARTKSLYVNPG